MHIQVLVVFVMAIGGVHAVTAPMPRPMPGPMPAQEKAALKLYRYRYNDSVKYDIKTQATCKEVAMQGPTRDCRWGAGLNPLVDQLVLKGRIAAYKIRWFNGGWSGWYVPGANDLDWKVNVRARVCSIPYRANTLRRVWSYFYDHSHKYIICKL